MELVINLMNMLKLFNWLLPKTFTFRILFILIFVSIVPLLFLGFFVTKTLTGDFLQQVNNQGKLVENEIIAMYHKQIVEESYFIDSQLKNVQNAVLNAQSLAREIYSNPFKYPLANSIHVYHEQEGYYWEKPSNEKGNVAIIDQKSPSRELIADLSRSKYLEPIFKQNVDFDPNIIAMYYLHPQSAFYNYPAVDVKTEVDHKFLNPQVKFTNYDFYQNALKVQHSQQIAWVDPYPDVTHRDRMFSATAPVYDDAGHLKGVVGADITIDNLVRNILDIKFKEPNAYAFVLEKSGELIAIQKNGSSDLPYIDLAQLQQIEQNGGIAEIHVNQNPKVLLSTKIPSTDWTLGYVIPKTEILNPIYGSSVQFIESRIQTFRKEIISISFIMLIFCIIITILFWLRLSQPLKSLSLGLMRVSDGDFDMNLGNSKYEEFNNLIRAFNKMSGRMKQLLDELRTLNRELENKVEERTNDLKITNEILQAKNDQLLNFENWRKSFFANISHDIKTPLTLIKGYIDAIIDGTISPNQVKPYLMRVDERIQSINYLIKQINNLSLLERDQVHENFTCMSAYSLFQKLIDRWKMNLEIKGYQVHVQSSYHTALVKVDYDLLERAINNLVENAMKYSPPMATVSFILHWEEDRVIFSVKDQGKGIPEAALPYLFDRFYRVDQSRNSNVQGNGLGLSIAQEIILIHKGEIWAARNTDQGSTFSFSIPYHHNLKDDNFHNSSEQLL